MAQRTRSSLLRPPWGRGRSVSGAAANAGQQFEWLWSRESVFRLALSALLATALWLYVTNKQQPGYLDFGQPIQVNTANLAGGLALTTQINPVRVRYRPDNSTLYVTPSNFQAELDLSGLGPGLHRHVPVQVTADPGITVLRVSPAHVAIVLDRIKTKQVPVTPRLQGRPPTGFEIGPASISPNSVTVRGPANILAKVAVASVQVFLQDQRTSISQRIAPILEDSQGTQVTVPTAASKGLDSVTITPSDVLAQVPIRPSASFKTVPVIPQTTGSPKSGFGLSRIAIQPPEVTLEGPASILSRIESVGTAPLSLAGRSAGHFGARLRVRLPRHISGDSASVTVQVTLQPVSASTTTKVGVIPSNVSPYLRANMQSAYVLVTLAGSASRLANAGRTTSAVLNLAGYGAGTYYVTPEIQAPRGLTVLNVQPRTVTVDLKSGP